MVAKREDCVDPVDDCSYVSLSPCSCRRKVSECVRIRNAAPEVESGRAGRRAFCRLPTSKLTFIRAPDCTLLDTATIKVIR